VDLPMLVVDLERRESRRGDFTMLTLAHRSERIATSPFWPEDQFRLAGVTRGQAVQVTGEIGQFNGRRQLKVATLVALEPGQFDPRELLPAIASPAPFWQALDRWRQAIRGPRLAHTVALFFDDTAFRARFDPARPVSAAITPSSAACCATPGKSPPSGEPSRAPAARMPTSS
jgi:hypothetical protein